MSTQHREQIILDIGCGTGEATIDLLTKFNTAEITAIDMSKEFIELARNMNKYDEIEFIQMNAESNWPAKWEKKFTLVRRIHSIEI